MNVVAKQKQQYVTIKGTKDGLTLQLDDRCSYEDLLKEIEERLIKRAGVAPNSPLVSVHLKVGNRYLTPEQEEELRALIRRSKNLVVDSIESNVISKAEALEWVQKMKISAVPRIVRSGQVLHVEGDLLLIGDVNPGGTVIAGGTFSSSVLCAALLMLGIVETKKLSSPRR